MDRKITLVSSRMKGTPEICWVFFLYNTVDAGLHKLKHIGTRRVMIALNEGQLKGMK